MAFDPRIWEVQRGVGSSLVLNPKQRSWSCFGAHGVQRRKPFAFCRRQFAMMPFRKDEEYAGEPIPRLWFTIFALDGCALISFVPLFQGCRALSPIAFRARGAQIVLSASSSCGKCLHVIDDRTKFIEKGGPIASPVRSSITWRHLPQEELALRTICAPRARNAMGE